MVSDPEMKELAEAEIEGKQRLVDIEAELQRRLAAARSQRRP
jgi:hypothetical protein